MPLLAIATPDQKLAQELTEQGFTFLKKSKKGFFYLAIQDDNEKTIEKQVLNHISIQKIDSAKFNKIVAKESGWGGQEEYSLKNFTGESASEQQQAQKAEDEIDDALLDAFSKMGVKGGGRSKSRKAKGKSNKGKGKKRGISRRR